MSTGQWAEGQARKAHAGVPAYTRVRCACVCLCVMCMCQTASRLLSVNGKENVFKILKSKLEDGKKKRFILYKALSGPL